jgi:hypothetical protein
LKNQTIKILKRPFKVALEEGLIDRNPVAAVRPIRNYLLELPGSDRPKKPLFPKLFAKPGAGKSGLSKDMNKHYTHLELQTVRRAVESKRRVRNCVRTSTR